MHSKRKTAALLSSVGICLGAGGCQEYVFEPVLSGLLSSWSEEIHIPIVSHFDILFVVDDSGSMAGNQQNLADNLYRFIELLDERNELRREEGRDPLDFQIGVASTSIVQRILSGGNVDHRDTYAIGANNSRCLDGTAYTFDSGTPYPAGRFMSAPGNHEVLTDRHFADDPSGALTQFQQNIRLGTCGSSQEEGMEAMRRVVSENPGFFRQNSRLVVVFLSDEEDCSDRTGNFVSYIITPEGIIDARLHPDYRDALTAVSFYRSFLIEMADDRNGSVAVASIVSAVGDPPHDMEAEVHPDRDVYEQWNCVDNVCLADCPTWCSTEYCPAECAADPDQDQCLSACQTRCTANPRHDPCWCGGHTPGARYLELAGMFSREDRIMDSVCNHDFSETLEDLVDIVDPDQCMFLGARPYDDDPGLVLIRIEREGQEHIVCTPPEGEGEEHCEAGADWWYDSDGPELCLCEDSRCVLEPGDSYRLSVVQRACSPTNPC